MSGIVNILKKEIGTYFLSPLAYVVMGFFLVLSGYFFASTVILSRYPEMNSTLSNMGLILLFVSPILTMRLIADDMRLGTDQLLLTSPLTVVQMVLGKYLAALSVYIVALLISMVYPLLLVIFGQPRIGVIMSGYLGIFLMGASFLAVGLFASSLSENQMIAGVIGFALLLLLWVIDWLSSMFTNPIITKILEYLSIFKHFNSMNLGIINLSDIVFYLSFIFVFLFLTVRVIDSRRWS